MGDMPSHETGGAGGAKPDIAAALVVCDAGGAQMRQSAQQVIPICFWKAARMSTGLSSSRRTTVWSPRPNPYTMGESASTGGGPCAVCKPLIPPTSSAVWPASRTIANGRNRGGDMNKIEVQHTGNPPHLPSAAWVRFLRSYGPTPNNLTMFDEYVSGALWLATITLAGVLPQEGMLPGLGCHWSPVIFNVLGPCQAAGGAPIGPCTSWFNPPPSTRCRDRRSAY